MTFQKSRYCFLRTSYSSDSQAAPMTPAALVELLQGKALNLALGFAHPVILDVPEGLEVKVDSPTEVTVSGFDKAAVGNFAAIIRSKRKPEPYKGKGVRYADEHVAIKEGKRK